MLNLKSRSVSARLANAAWRNYALSFSLALLFGVPRESK